MIRRSKITTQQIIQEFRTIHSDKYDYSLVDYTHSKIPITIVCPIHGPFKQLPNTHLNGAGCKHCGNNKIVSANKLSNKEFIDKAKITHGDRYDYSKVNYINSKTDIVIICKEHGEFLQLPTVHFQGCGCSKCRLKNQTKLFDLLKDSFPNEYIKWEYSPEWLGRQKFDISFPKYNIAIEYNGQQHYYPIARFGGELGFNKTIERDSIKKDKCKLHNWDIIDIKYDYTLSDYDSLITFINDKINKPYSQ